MMREAGLPLDALAAHGRSMMRWGLDNQDGFADSPYSSVGEARHCWGRVRGVSILRFPKMERLRVVPSPLLELPIG